MNARRRDSKRKNWPDNLYCKTDGYFWYRNPATGKTKGLGHDRMIAFDEARNANMVLASQKPSSLVEWVQGIGGKTLAAWGEEYRDIYVAERGMAENTIKQMKTYVRLICDTSFAKKQINVVSTVDVSDFIRDAEKNRGGRSAQKLRSILNDMFIEAEARGLIERGTNPVTVTRKPKAEVQRDRLSLEQFLAIRAQAEGWLVNAMNLALISGQRREDIACAEFKDIKDGFWYCTQGKTGNKLRIALSLRLAAIGLSVEDVVKQCRKNVVSKHLIHYTKSYSGVKAGEQVGLQRISKAFAAARDKAGITAREGKTPPSFHEIRSLSERLHEKERGGQFTQKLLGHKSAKMTALYHDVRGSEWIDVAAG